MKTASPSSIVTMVSGKTTDCYNGFKLNSEGGVITTTVVDNLHNREDKLVIEIDPT